MKKLLASVAIAAGLSGAALGLTTATASADTTGANKFVPMSPSHAQHQERWTNKSAVGSNFNARIMFSPGFAAYLNSI